MLILHDLWSNIPLNILTSDVGAYENVAVIAVGLKRRT
jgi:hypothetical protein